ncbi:MAG: 2OG-Fe(II) oxygenase [Alphaproteobacteria bacterium]|jgi:hypothetical protein|nr:2OG-Fe(II) oxygenase [Alphaproteobacteria bacterium]
MTDDRAARPGHDFSATPLAKWVQPQHLAAGAVAALRRQFDSRPERLIHVDEFLLSHHVDAIRQVLLGDGVVEPAYKVAARPGQARWIGREEFDHTPDGERVIAEFIYRHPRPGRELAASILTDVMFRRELQGDSFMGWLAAATGRPIRRCGTINLKLLDHSSMLRWHSDRNAGRLLCMVFYVHATWPEAFGGRFLMQRLDGGVEAVAPLCNRLVLFDPQVEVRHAVEDIAAAAGTHGRMNYSVWYYD